MCLAPSHHPAAFPCHENGATVLQYAPKQQLLITGGRKGFVCVFDIRQRQLLHTFQAHDSAIKALALDAFEDFFVTGSAEGNMKVTRHSPNELPQHIRAGSAAARRLSQSRVLSVAVGE